MLNDQALYLAWIIYWSCIRPFWKLIDNFIFDSKSSLCLFGGLRRIDSTPAFLSSI